MNIAHILSTVGYDNEAQVYEGVPDVNNIESILPAASHQQMSVFELVPNIPSAAGDEVYERVPDVNFSQILSAVRLHERVQHVPNVNISPSAVDRYERAQIYERVPDVNFTQLLSEAGLYERAQTYQL